MFRKLLCLLCTLLLLGYSVPVFSESAAGNRSYDFDLTFQLNSDSFPELLRARAAGYASLINRLGIRGNIAWNENIPSFNLNATLYYTDDPSLTYPLRIYGVKSRVFITSPMINNEVILLNMAALMEFSIKAKNTLNLPLSYLALLIPYTTESALDGLVHSWQEVIGTFTASGKISADQFDEVSGLWQNELLNNNYLRFWIAGVAGGSDAPEVVESEMNSLPVYLESISGGQSVSVTVDSGSEIWRNAAGDILFSRQESDGNSSVLLSLPASPDGYVPYYSSSYCCEDQTFSMDIDASLCRDATAVSADASSETDAGQVVRDEYGQETGDDDYDGYSYDAYDEDEEYDEYDGEYEYGEDEDSDMPAPDLPETLLKFRLNGSGFPREYPADASFALSVSVLGAVYPNYTFSIAGTTKKDGAVSLSLSKPFSSNADQVEIFRCAGTIVPVSEPEAVPDYLQETMDGYYNVLSFNEQKLSAFTEKVFPPLIRSVFSFIAAAPTSACQSFLDDLTDIGVLDMLLD